ncbi:MAG: cobalamin-dependent protein [Oscillospiraceae bacterium]|nr:cobalamin-dependent protein [Oscillospiraceae bacterium]
MTEMERLSMMVELGDGSGAHDCAAGLLRSGASPEKILREGVMPGMSQVGIKFEKQTYFIPEMLRAARAVKQVTELLRQALPVAELGLHKRAAIGTVQNDLHDIGKNLVEIAMVSIGIEVVDLGVDVSPEQFVQAAVQDDSIAIVGVSALLTTTMPAMRRTVAALRSCSAADRIRIFVGGAPVTADFAADIGADCYTESAFEAATLARRLLDEIEGGKPWTKLR